MCRVADSVPVAPSRVRHGGLPATEVCLLSYGGLPATHRRKGGIRGGGATEKGGVPGHVGWKCMSLSVCLHIFKCLNMYLHGVSAVLVVSSRKAVLCLSATKPSIIVRLLCDGPMNMLQFWICTVCKLQHFTA